MYLYKKIRNILSYGNSNFIIMYILFYWGIYVWQRLIKSKINMDNGIFINNVFVNWEESRLFDLYCRYLEGLAERYAFIDHNGYDHFESAKRLYNKIM